MMKLVWVAAVNADGASVDIIQIVEEADGRQFSVEAASEAGYKAVEEFAEKSLAARLKLRAKGVEPEKVIVGWRRPVTAEVIEREIAGRGYVSWSVIDPATLPPREYRDAWVSTPAGIDIDMDRAREIRKAALRPERDASLAKLDVAYLQALEADDKATQAFIATRKQALRDMTDDPGFAAASTPEALSAFVPACLK